MRIHFTILFVAFSLAGYAQPKSDELDIQKAITTVFDGIAHASFAVIKSVLTDDFVLLENGEIWNQDTIAKRVEVIKDKKITRVNKLEFQRTEISGNTAFVYYWNNADITLNEVTRTVRWLESAVLTKKNGSWKIQLLHSTRLK